MKKELMNFLKNFRLKIISSIVLTCFLFSLSGAEYMGAMPKVMLPASANLILDPDQGRVIESFKGKGNKVVICIQDLHSNKEVANNIFSILDSIKHTYKKDIKNIFVEGAWTKLKLDFVRSVPNEKYKIREKLLDDILDRGLLTGQEKFAILEDLRLGLIGIENKSLYIKDRDLLVESFKTRNNALKFLDLLKDKIERIKEKTYSKELLKFEKTVSNYNKGKISIIKYLETLKAYAESLNINFNEFVHIDKLIKLINTYQGLAREGAVSIEARELILRLDDILTENDKKTLNELQEKNDNRFYLYLKTLITKHNIALTSNFGSLRTYLKYLELSSTLNTEKLVEEDVKLISDIKFFLSDTIEAKELLELDEIVNLKKDFLNNSVSSKKSDMFLTDHVSINNKIKSFVNNHNNDIVWFEQMRRLYKDMQRTEVIMRDFYSLALKRNKALVNNTLKHKNKVSVMVVGGYHSKGIADLLRAKDISHILISPNIKSDHDNTIYNEIIREQKQKGIRLSTLAFQPLFTGELDAIDQAMAQNVLTQLATAVRALGLSEEALKEEIIAWMGFWNTSYNDRNIMVRFLPAGDDDPQRIQVYMVDENGEETILDTRNFTAITEAEDEDEEAETTGWFTAEDLMDDDIAEVMEEEEEEEESDGDDDQAADAAARRAADARRRAADAARRRAADAAARRAAQPIIPTPGKVRYYDIILPDTPQLRGQAQTRDRQEISRFDGDKAAEGVTNWTAEELEYFVSTSEDERVKMIVENFAAIRARIDELPLRERVAGYEQIFYVLKTIEYVMGILNKKGNVLMDVFIKGVIEDRPEDIGFELLLYTDGGLRYINIPGADELSDLMGLFGRNFNSGQLLKEGIVNTPVGEGDLERLYREQRRLQGMDNRLVPIFNWLIQNGVFEFGQINVDRIVNVLRDAIVYNDFEEGSTGPTKLVLRQEFEEEEGADDAEEADVAVRTFTIEFMDGTIVTRDSQDPDNYVIDKPQVETTAEIEAERAVREQEAERERDQRRRDQEAAARAARAAREAEEAAAAIVGVTGQERFVYAEEESDEAKIRAAVQALYEGAEVVGYVREDTSITQADHYVFGMSGAESVIGRKDVVRIMYQGVEHDVEVVRFVQDWYQQTDKVKNSGDFMCTGTFGDSDINHDTGWATWSSVTDAKLNQIVAKLHLGRGTGEDWADPNVRTCEWNSLQNYIFIRTGIKVTVEAIMNMYVTWLITQDADKLDFFAQQENPFWGFHTYLNVVMGLEEDDDAFVQNDATWWAGDPAQRVPAGAQKIMTRIGNQTIYQHGPVLIRRPGFTFLLVPRPHTYVGSAKPFLITDPHIATNRFHSVDEGDVYSHDITVNMPTMDENSAEIVMVTKGIREPVLSIQSFEKLTREQIEVRVKLMGLVTSQELGTNLQLVLRQKGVARTQAESYEEDVQEIAEVKARALRQALAPGMPDEEPDDDDARGDDDEQPVRRERPETPEQKFINFVEEQNAFLNSEHGELDDGARRIKRDVFPRRYSRPYHLYSWAQEKVSQLLYEDQTKPIQRIEIRQACRRGRGRERVPIFVVMGFDEDNQLVKAYINNRSGALATSEMTRLFDSRGERLLKAEYLGLPDAQTPPTYSLEKEGDRWPARWNGRRVFNQNMAAGEIVVELVLEKQVALQTYNREKRDFNALYQRFWRENVMSDKRDGAQRGGQFPTQVMDDDSTADRLKKRAGMIKKHSRHLAFVMDKQIINVVAIPDEANKFMITCRDTKRRYILELNQRNRVRSIILAPLRPMDIYEEVDGEVNPFNMQYLEEYLRDNLELDDGRITEIKDAIRKFYGYQFQVANFLPGLILPQGIRTMEGDRAAAAAALGALFVGVQTPESFDLEAFLYQVDSLDILMTTELYEEGRNVYTHNVKGDGSCWLYGYYRGLKDIYDEESVGLALNGAHPRLDTWGQQACDFFKQNQLAGNEDDVSAFMRGILAVKYNDEDQPWKGMLVENAMRYYDLMAQGIVDSENFGTNDFPRIYIAAQILTRDQFQQWWRRDGHAYFVNQLQTKKTWSRALDFEVLSGHFNVGIRVKGHTNFDVNVDTADFRRKNVLLNYTGVHYMHIEMVPPTHRGSGQAWIGPEERERILLQIATAGAHGMVVTAENWHGLLTGMARDPQEVYVEGDPRLEIIRRLREILPHDAGEEQARVLMFENSKFSPELGRDRRVADNAWTLTTKDLDYILQRNLETDGEYLRQLILHEETESANKAALMAEEAEKAAQREAEGLDDADLAQGHELKSRTQEVIDNLAHDMVLQGNPEHAEFYREDRKRRFVWDALQDAAKRERGRGVNRTSVTSAMRQYRAFVGVDMALVEVQEDAVVDEDIRAEEPLIIYIPGRITIESLRAALTTRGVDLDDPTTLGRPIIVQGDFNLETEDEDDVFGEIERITEIVGAVPGGRFTYMPGGTTRSAYRAHPRYIALLARREGGIKLAEEAFSAFVPAEIGQAVSPRMYAYGRELFGAENFTEATAVYLLINLVNAQYLYEAINAANPQNPERAWGMFCGLMLENTGMSYDNMRDEFLQLRILNDLNFGLNVRRGNRGYRESDLAEWMRNRSVPINQIVRGLPDFDDEEAEEGDTDGDDDDEEGGQGPGRGTGRTFMAKVVRSVDPDEESTTELIPLGKVDSTFDCTIEADNVVLRAYETPEDDDPLDRQGMTVDRVVELEDMSKLDGIRMRIQGVARQTGSVVLPAAIRRIIDPMIDNDLREQGEITSDTEALIANILSAA